MKDKLLSFLVLPSIMFALFLAFSPVGSAEAISVQEEGWVDTSACVANSCGSSEGTKTQDYYSEVCETTCPEVTFTASRRVVDIPEHYVYTDKVIDNPGTLTCPNGYSEGWLFLWHYCKHGNDKYDFNDVAVLTGVTYMCPVGYENNPGHDNCRKLIADTYKTETFSVTFNYDKAPADKNHCHKPTPESLNIPAWARDDYGKLQVELDAAETDDCQFEVTNTQTVPCSDAPIVDCPVMCEWNDQIPATDENCPTTCEWDSTIPSTDENCKAPVMCEWNDQILATDENCKEPTMCKWNEELEADDPTCPTDCQYDATISSVDPLCAPEDDEPDVLGEDDETGVVLAATGPTDNIVVYIVELLLVAILVTYSVFFTKTYLKNSK